jgi:hypothetical protein
MSCPCQPCREKRDEFKIGVCIGSALTVVLELVILAGLRLITGPAS